MTEISVEAGGIIFREGDEANEAYIVRDGEVEILKHAQAGEVKLATLGVHDLLGELALFEQGVPRSATARATKPTSLDVMTREEFEQLLGQCPPRLMPIIMTVLDRLRSSNKRISENEVASVILEVDIEKVRITSENESIIFDPLEVQVARLPLKIGGYIRESGPDKRHQQNHINIAFDESPPIVSPQHCQIEVYEGGIYLRDLGSRFGTTANGKLVGRGKGVYIAPLQKGENTVRMGGEESSVIVKIECL